MSVDEMLKIDLDRNKTYGSLLASKLKGAIQWTDKELIEKGRKQGALEAYKKIRDSLIFSKCNNDIRLNEAKNYIDNRIKELEGEKING